jgi:hypothetical protein
MQTATTIRTHPGELPGLRARVACRRGLRRRA